MAAGKSLDDFLKEVRANSSFLPPKAYENNNDQDSSPGEVVLNGTAAGSTSRKRTERDFEPDRALNLDKDDDIQFVAEFLDDEPDIDALVGLPLTEINGRYSPKVKRPRRAIDFDEDQHLLLDLEYLNREQKKNEPVASTSKAAYGHGGSSRSSTWTSQRNANANVDDIDTDDVEIVVRHRQVLRLIPTVPHVKIACEDGSRVYLRLSPDPDKVVVNTNPSILEQISMMAPREEVRVQKRHGLLGVGLDVLRKRYDEEQKKFNVSMAIASAAVNNSKRNQKENDNLWVEKYKPQSYMDLLSEESINHTLLHWLKLWDNAVFGSDYITKVRQTKEKYASLVAKDADRFKKIIIDDGAYDEMGRPKQKVVLLHGPPGLGKTTAAHIICKHAGYSVIELNASDDRSVDIFKKTLDSATQSRSEMFQDGRPTCLIIDEIDGAPLQSVQVLVELITGKAAETGKNKAKKILRRPIICICNELYAPSLKHLKKLALLVPFQPISVSALVDRLEDISLREKMEINSTTMYALAEKTDCDVRSCLSCLQFMKTKEKAKPPKNGATSVRVAPEDGEKMLEQLGIQDKNKGIFDVWKEIFGMPERKNRTYYGKDKIDPTRVDARFDHILKTAQSFGEYEKLFEGVFENYLHSNFKDSFFNKILMGLEWVCWFDQIQSFIKHQQNHSLLGLLPFYFVTAHFLYAGKGFAKLQYPTFNEATSTANRFLATTKSQITDMEPNVARYVDVPSLTLDVFPALISIIQPSSIRPVPTQLWSPKERETLKIIVDIMLAYNLTYTQERGPDGQYIFAMDPDIESLTTFKFDEMTANRKQFAYAVKQLVAREIETEKLRRGDASNGNGSAMDVDQIPKVKPKPFQRPAPAPASAPFQPQKSQSQTESQGNSQMSNESQELTVTKERKAKPFNLSDYFNVKIIPKKVDGDDGKNGGTKKGEMKNQASEIYYRFKSGYTNAVRRNVRMKDLL